MTNFILQRMILLKSTIIFLIALTLISISVFAQTIHKPVAKPAAVSPAVNGKKIYIQYCLSCHQADGGGVQNMNPSLIGTQYVLGDKARIIKIVLKGFNEAVEINGQTYTNAMPAFSYLKDKDIADVLTYIRGHFSNNAGAVKTTEVTSIRGPIKNTGKKK
jgi:mono/diheme cytochrome c family protein